MSHPVCVFVLSGKRKSGKDYIAELLQSKLGQDKCAILRLSGPLKKQYALEHGLDWERLLDSSSYKEKFREDMIRWGEERRNKNPAYFCKLAAEEGKNFPVWIVSDARRKTDVEYFRQEFGDCVKTVRVVASEDIRRSRGWVFTAGVDDAESECGLDKGVTFDVVIENNGNVESLQSLLDELCSSVTDKL